MFSDKEIHRASSNRDKLNQEQQNAAKVTSSWESEGWRVDSDRKGKQWRIQKKKEEEEPNGAKALKNVFTLLLKRRRDTGRKTLAQEKGRQWQLMYFCLRVRKIMQS